MRSTLSIFEDRKEELEIYFSIMKDVDSEQPTIHTINNPRFFRILKSNYLLMLYNLVEACTVSGIMEIYESLKSDNCSYKDVIDEIKNIWVSYQVGKVYSATTSQNTYEKRVHEIISSITENTPIILDRDAFKISGNLDSRRIRSLCDKHRIRYVASDDSAALKMVKDKRNSLSHGDVSFSDCARDLTLNDLDDIKNAVVIFMQGILSGMSDYYENKGYRNPA